MKPLQAKDLTDQVQIRRKAETPNGKGGFVTSWPLIDTPWAKVIGLSGRLDGKEGMLEKVLQGISIYQVTIRYREDLLLSDQLRFGSIDLNILSSIDPDGRRDRLIVLTDTAAEPVDAE